MPRSDISNRFLALWIRRNWRLSSSHEGRHGRKDPEHYDVYDSRNGVSLADILANRETAQPEYDCELHSQQEGQRDRTDAQPCGQCKWQEEMASHPTRC